MENTIVVYAIANDKDEIYIGYTEDIDQRLKRHNGELKSKSTSYSSRRRDGQWKLIYTESCGTRKDAMRREKQLKSHQGRSFIRSLMDKNSGA